MTSAWETAGTLPLRPPDDLDDADVVITDHGTYWECGATDWHLMLGWFAGPATLMRYPDDRERWSTVIEIDTAGNRRLSRERLTDEELLDEDEKVNERLRDRGIPPRPSGFRWFQLVPPGGTGRDVVATYLRVQREMPAGYDVTRETTHTRAAIETLYQRPVTPPPLSPPPVVAAAPRRVAGAARAPELMTGPPGAVPVLRCRDLRRALAFYTALGFRAAELPGYAVVRDGATEIHLSRTGDASPGGCLIRVPDAAGLWKRLGDQPTLGPLDTGDPGMRIFTLLDPDGNELIFVSR